LSGLALIRGEPRAELRIRPAREGDSAGISALLATSLAEIPGATPGRPLAAPQAGGVFVASEGGRIVGLAAIAPHDAEGTFEITHLVVTHAARGRGLASRLLAAAEGWVPEARRLILWCDTRADAAQRFFEKHSFLREGPIRVDAGQTLAFGYAKPAAGIAVAELDAAAASSADRRLGDILAASAAEDEAVPLASPAEARRYWRGVSAEVAGGQRVLIAGWVDGVLAGSVQLDINTPPYQDHRAEAQHLLILPGYRGGGLAEALMRAVEAAAQRHGRRLLTLNAIAGGPAEALARDLGWIEGGRIPGFSVTKRGVSCDALFFWKALAGLMR
jgi:GNAT superfamily N-acetyltransferase